MCRAVVVIIYCQWKYIFFVESSGIYRFLLAVEVVGRKILDQNILGTFRCLCRLAFTTLINYGGCAYS